MAGKDGRSLMSHISAKSLTALDHRRLRKALGMSVLMATVLALSACSQTSRFNQGGVAPVQPARPLAPAPLPQVNEGTLGPASETGALVPPPPSSAEAIPPTPAAPELGTPSAPTSQPTQVAAVDPAASSQPVTRQGMVGAWTVSTGGSNCQIFLALTKWSGGYRAASRGCRAAALKDVQAWDVKGKQVVLVNSSGSTAATLFRSSGERFDGSTTSGGSISFSR
ncbi:MAG: AprI/Inh family metalloprotease inhibitor [Pseudomonadota bacterium]